MVSIQAVRAANIALVKKQPLVAVFVGSTFGIGEFSARALAATHGTIGKGLRLYIVGRNEVAARKILADCLVLCPAGDFRFVKAIDLSLLKDVDRVSAEVIKIEEAAAKANGEKARIDILVMTPAFVSLEGRKETTEGLDSFMSLLYYARMRFANQVLPLLLASTLPAHIVTVFAPNRAEKLIPGDMSLRDPKNYGFMSSGSHAAYMMTTFIEKFVAQHPGKLSISHYFPGLVITDGFFDERMPKYFRYFFILFGRLIRRFTVQPNESGERVIFMATDRFPASAVVDPRSAGDLGVATASNGIIGGGAYRVNWNGETLPEGKGFKEVREGGLAEKWWDHTMDAFDTIEAGKVFTR